jgi:uroporphyrinogen decarboxylase
MHKDDQMTPKERRAALNMGEAVDRMPISMFYFAPGPRLMGWTRRQGDASARTRADIQKKTYEVFGIDGVNAKYGLHAMAIAFGAIMSDPENDSPAILEHPIKDITDLSILDLDVVTIKNDPNAKKCYEMAQMLLEEIGDEVGCVFGSTAPFTSASALLGPERLLRALLKNPDQVHKLMEFTTQASLQLAKPFLELGLSLSISDPVASGSLLRKRHFDEFVVPYTRRVIQGCKAISPSGITGHICGDTTSILESMVECGYDVISLDNAVDLKIAKERVGDKVHLLGNVDPVNILRSGTPDDVRQNVRECFAKAWDNPKGYIIGTGCDTPLTAPLENSLAFMEEARKCAKYPLNPDNFK